MASQQILLETEIIARAQGGSEDAFGELYQRHLQAIDRYIHRRVGEYTDAEDLTQTVFIKAWQALADYRPGKSPFRAWLYRIARNTVIDYYRARRDFVGLDELATMAADDAPPERTLLVAEEQSVVHAAIAKLRPAHRAVIVRRFLQELDYSETATELGRQINSVRVIQHRALDTLRQLLQEPSALWIALATMLVALALSAPIVQAAEQALPGDSLYPMRTAVEAARLYLADDRADISLHSEFATRRIRDLDILATQGREEAVATTSSQLVNEINQAAAKLISPAAGDDATTLLTEFEETLTEQAATLNALAERAASPQQAPIQSALDAIGAARQQIEQPSAPSPATDALDDVPHGLPNDSARHAPIDAPADVDVDGHHNSMSSATAPPKDSGPQSANPPVRATAVLRDAPTANPKNPTEPAAAASQQQAAHNGASDPPRNEVATTEPDAQSATVLPAATDERDQPKPTDPRNGVEDAAPPKPQTQTVEPVNSGEQRVGDEKAQPPVDRADEPNPEEQEQPAQVEPKTQAVEPVNSGEQRVGDEKAQPPVDRADEPKPEAQEQPAQVEPKTQAPSTTSTGQVEKEASTKPKR